MNGDLVVLAFIALALLALFTYMFYRDLSNRPKSKPAEVYTVIKCGDGAERKRKYQEGDYVGKQTQDCPGGIVVGIYKEVPQE
ncbi:MULTISPECIES: hypothetical protein [Pyrobaculum]|uniref:Uncharacterized protein n=2 Tax=Pyrobaculum arsenaticum TaxID=121277 RepID=A4WKI9_PYRAR|nr:hypothetical protein [Pyrobaculum arsenaticum]ABP50906.1 conserved hypothetical protein [Pyrobaculum arsenaticum DSM 13514]MCY0891305.1 hypothetical protein [Pyrobaculum arsenaticum]NYR15374.1 hypothetical protein [Pyrobaculum arsenaticum]